MAIVPCIKHAVLWIVVDLRVVGVIVYKRQTRDHLRMRVGIKRVGDVGVCVLEAVNRVQNATDDETVSIIVPPQAGSPRFLFLQIRGV